jgi:hypothetical protein
MARILPMPSGLSKVLDRAGLDKVKEIAHALISERGHAEFQKQACREHVIEAADEMNGLVLEYHPRSYGHDRKFFFAVESIEAFEALVSVFEVMDH